MGVNHSCSSNYSNTTRGVYVNLIQSYLITEQFSPTWLEVVGRGSEWVKTTCEQQLLFVNNYLHLNLMFKHILFPITVISAVNIY